jgi:flagellar motor protein MotB
MSAKNAKNAKALAKAESSSRRLVRIELSYSRDAFRKANSGNLTCSVTARSTLMAILNLQKFFKNNSSSDDAKLKPLLQEVQTFLDEFNQGSFSSEFCTIWKLAGSPMSLIVLQ